MKNKILKWLGIADIQSEISKINDKFYKLEEGIMHDDYPKCKAPQDSAFYICKHGRITAIERKLKGRHYKIRIKNYD